MAQSLIKHYGRSRFNAFRIVTPQAVKRAALKEDVCSHSVSIMD